MGTRPEILYAAGIFMLSNFVDHMDGELARLTGKSSRFGYHYDNYSDALIHVALFVCIGIGLQDSWIGGWAPLARPDRRSFGLGALPHLLAELEQRAGERQARQPMFKGIHLEDAMYFIGPITWGGGLIVLLLAGVALPPLYVVWLALARAAAPVRQATGRPHDDHPGDRGDRLPRLRRRARAARRGPRGTRADASGSRHAQHRRSRR